MPYVPPTGTAVDFDFTDVHYFRPPGRSILFNFGAVPGPPFIDDQLPTGLKQYLFAEEQWTSPVVRRFAPVVDSIISKPMRARFGLDDAYDDALWTMPRRRILVVPPFSVGRRPILFTVT